MYIYIYIYIYRSIDIYIDNAPPEFASSISRSGGVKASREDRGPATAAVCLAGDEAPAACSCRRSAFTPNRRSVSGLFCCRVRVRVTC